jgi:hypothetical protein
MTSDEKPLNEGTNVSEDKPEEFIIDLRKVYSYKPENLKPDISIVRYSNLAYINTNNRDIHIDFLEMPGIIKDDKVLLNGTRIYMSHAAAQKLAERLLETLEQVHSIGKMEKYLGMEKVEKGTN